MSLDRLRLILIEVVMRNFSYFASFFFFSYGFDSVLVVGKSIPLSTSVMEKKIIKYFDMIDRETHFIDFPLSSSFSPSSYDEKIREVISTSTHFILTLGVSSSLSFRRHRNEFNQRHQSTRKKKKTPGLLTFSKAPPRWSHAKHTLMATFIGGNIHRNEAQKTNEKSDRREFLFRWGCQEIQRADFGAAMIKIQLWITSGNESVSLSPRDRYLLLEWKINQHFSSFLTLSEAKSETDLCVCIVSNCSRHQSSSSRVAIACDNELSSRMERKLDVIFPLPTGLFYLMLSLSPWKNSVTQLEQNSVDWIVSP